MTAAERDVCNKAWDKWERVRVEEFGWSPGEPPVDQPPDFCKDLLEVPEAEIRQAVKQATEECGGDCRRLVPR